MGGLQPHPGWICLEQKAGALTLDRDCVDMVLSTLFARIIGALRPRHRPQPSALPVVSVVPHQSIAHSVSAPRQQR